MRLQDIVFGVGAGLLLIALAGRFHARPTPAEAVVSTIQDTMPLPPSQTDTDTDTESADAAATEFLKKLRTDPINHEQHAHRLKDLLPQVSDAMLVCVARDPVMAYRPLIEATDREIFCRLLLRLPPP